MRDPPSPVAHPCYRGGLRSEGVDRVLSKLPSQAGLRVGTITAANAALVIVSAWLLGCGGAPPTPPPSLLVLVTVDTLRADRLGAYGSDLGLTPHIDALAEQSVVFTSAYAPASFTVPSVSTLMTGRYPEELGIWKNESGLPASAATLASSLRERGWRTLAVVSNFVLRRASGLDAGFDRFDDTLPQYEAVRKWPERVGKDTTDAALAMLDACATGVDTRCFLWVHYQDPHGPYTPDPALRRRFLDAERKRPGGRRMLPAQPGSIGLGGIPAYQFVSRVREVAFYRAGYDAEVNAMDQQVGRLLQGIEDRGLGDRTVTVFAADHGESLGESDYWFAHGEHLTDVLVCVPLLFRIPGHAPQRRDDVVSLVDLYGTLVRLLTGSPPDANPHGRDLFVDGAPQRASAPYMATLGASRVRRYGLVEAGFKWIVSELDEVPTGKLYRLGDDATDLAAQNPQMAAQMQERLVAVRGRLDRSTAERRPDLSDDDREKLRALGYIDD
jgi:arylsulfatase A-like enzyme